MEDVAAAGPSSEPAAVPGEAALPASKSGRRAGKAAPEGGKQAKGDEPPAASTLPTGVAERTRFLRRSKLLPANRVVKLFHGR